MNDTSLPSPSIAMIAAVADNGVIGTDGGMPWRMSTDLRRFKQLTLGKPLVMGRATYDSLGGPLAGRDHIVVTSRGVSEAGVLVVRSIEEAIERARESAARTGADEIMVIGGGLLYAASISHADRLYITHVHGDPFGDTFFPEIDLDQWEAGPAEFVPAGERDDYDSDFVTYRRRR